MMKAPIKKLMRSIFRFLPIGIIPLDSILWISYWVSSKFARLLLFHDWQLEANGRPQFFKHQINIARWCTEPSRWSFSARGVYAREIMFKNCKVLDLCSGDGIYSYMFFSDIASHIDAVDNDKNAINYARKYHSNSKINYYKLNVVTSELPSSEYDVVVWNAAICYFEIHEIHQILRKIIDAGKPEMRFTGMLPKANGWVDHKTEFLDIDSIKQLLLNYFQSVVVKEVDEVSSITYYFYAATPLKS